MRSNEKRRRQVHYGAEGPHDHRQPEWFANPDTLDATTVAQIRRRPMQSRRWTQNPVRVAKAAIPADLPADFRRRLVAAVNSAD